MVNQQKKIKADVEISEASVNELEKEIALDLRRAIAEDVRKNIQAANQNVLNEDAPEKIGGEPANKDVKDIERETDLARREKIKPNFGNVQPANDNKPIKNIAGRDKISKPKTEEIGVEDAKPRTDEQSESGTGDKEASENPFEAPATEEGLPARADIGEIGQEKPTRPQEEQDQNEKSGQPQLSAKSQSQIAKIDSALRQFDKQRKSLNRSILPLKAKIAPLQLAKYMIMLHIFLLRLLQGVFASCGCCLTFIGIGLILVGASALITTLITASKTAKKIIEKKINGLKNQIKSANQEINRINQEISREEDNKMRLEAQANE